MSICSAKALRCVPVGSVHNVVRHCRLFTAEMCPGPRGNKAAFIHAALFKRRRLLKGWSPGKQMPAQEGY